jgi:hypothetical protein
VHGDGLGAHRTPFRICRRDPNHSRGIELSLTIANASCNNHCLFSLSGYNSPGLPDQVVIARCGCWPRFPAKASGRMILAWVPPWGSGDGATTVRHLRSTWPPQRGPSPASGRRAASEEHTGYLNCVSLRSVAWRRRRGAVWSSAAGERVGAAVVGEEAGAESATPQRPVPSRAMCGTPPGELVRDAQGTRVDSRSHPAPVAWRGQAWWSSFARSGVSPRAPGRIARGRRPGPGGRRGGHAWPG